MQCLGRTKTFSRCKNKTNFLVCHPHRWQPIIFLLITIPTILSSYFDIYQSIFKENIDSFRPNKVISENTIEPFENTENEFNILILPFEPLENCNFKEVQLEETIRRRLTNISERDSLSLNVKFDTTQICPSTFNEGKAIGKAFSADLVIWGDFYERCYTDTTKACLKYILLKKSNLNIETSGETNVLNIASMADITQGFLQKDIDYVIYWTLAEEGLIKGDFKKALYHFKAVENRSFDRYEELYIKMGLCYSGLGQYDSSATHYNKALRINPENLNALLNLGIIYTYHYHKYWTAGDYFDKAIKINPQYPGSHFNLAVLRQDFFGDRHGARKHYLIELENNPNSYRTHINLGALLMNSYSDYRRAKEHFLKSIEVNPNGILGYLNLARIYENFFHDYQKTKEYYLKALEINPNSYQVHYYLAVLYKNSLGDPEVAKKHYLKACEFNSKIKNDRNDKYFFGLY